tara:strand:- start:41 stop:2185 length:2145 start_codon:yes stop_codon:yes gene_type:complete
MNIGINGFGRIGKTIFLQLLDNKLINVKAINIPDFDINNLESYLKNDSVHHYNKDFQIKILSESCFEIDNKKIYLLNNRDPSLLNWQSYNIDYVIDSTGAFLTIDKASKHNCNYVIMCAPPKDNTPQFIYNVNHDSYNGESIISNASCTTNCITPVLKCLMENNEIISANFTTVHATTASQNVSDTIKFKNRTRRSILNNIIPHSTGASKSIAKVLPELENKIKGTSLRVPVSNVSIVDLNVKLKNKTSIEEIFELFRQSEYVKLEENNLVSVDFISNKCPSIVDKNASMELFDNEFKLMIWYDNEWSYSNKLIKLVEHIYKHNTKEKENNKYFITNNNFEDKRVVLRLDWNVPILNDRITDYYRISSSLKTIKYILSKNPKYILIVSHLGRPKNKEEKYSWKKYIEQINIQLGNDFPTINLLENGVSQNTLETLNKFKKNIDNSNLFLLENIRFHDEETKKCDNEKTNNFINLYKQFGDIFVNDAFGCCHRDHVSITSFRNFNRAYGFLIEKEINVLKSITKNINNDKILSIVGGSKIDDKLQMIKNLSHKIDGIYIAGGNINSIYKNEKYKNYLNEISDNNSTISLMKDGLAASNLEEFPTYISGNINDHDNLNFYDIGMKSILELSALIDEHDVIFWNGTLGVVENNWYSCGSKTLIDILNKSNKKVIIGGGDTAGFVNNYTHSFYYVSTGGGASLEFLSKNSLVGLDIFS